MIPGLVLGAGGGTEKLLNYQSHLAVRCQGLVEAHELLLEEGLQLKHLGFEVVLDDFHGHDLFHWGLIIK